MGISIWTPDSHCLIFTCKIATNWPYATDSAIAEAQEQEWILLEVGKYLFEEYASPPSDRPSGLALQDVGGQGLQFGRPVRGGQRWPQDEL